MCIVLVGPDWGGGWLVSWAVHESAHGWCMYTIQLTSQPAPQSNPPTQYTSELHIEIIVNLELGYNNNFVSRVDFASEIVDRADVCLL